MMVKAALEEMLPATLIVRGEISDWKVHSSGHCYFSLKDQSGVLPCVMWASKYKAVKFEPEDGLAVLATGHIDVYPQGGKYQLYVDKLEPEGVGALQLAFEQMVRKLEKEGLFDPAHKRPLPAYPMRIGILTSESGAAVHDIAESIWNRWPCANLFLYPVPVQGVGAAEKIAAALREVNRRNKLLRLEVLIVGRGGGSLEDLWAFNEEVLARAIYDSKIPVISAVGHEVDTTVADLVADARASTPTKAGVVAVPDAAEVLADLSNKQSRLWHKMTATVQLACQNLQTVLASAVFRNPLSMIRDREQCVDEVGLGLSHSMRGIMTDAKERLHRAYEQVVRIEPHRLLRDRLVRLNDWQNRARLGIGAVVHRRREQLAGASNRLEGLNPKSVLRRGYSITRSGKNGSVVKDSKEIQIGDLLVTELAGENLIESQVTRK